jgi:hypothetical protein
MTNERGDRMPRSTWRRPAVVLVVAIAIEGIVLAQPVPGVVWRIAMVVPAALAVLDAWLVSREGDRLLTIVGRVAGKLVSRLFARPRS